MKITKELLDRFVVGKCTAEERQAIALWLEDTDADIASIDESIDMKKLQNEVWDDISTNFPQLRMTDEPSKKQKRLWYFTRYAAAVLLIFGITVLFSKRNSAKSLIHIENNSSNKTTHRDLSDIPIDLASFSSAEIRPVFWGSSYHINFCGGMVIHPLSNMEIDFNSNCDTLSSTKITTMSFKRGKSYLAFQSTFKGTESVVINKDRAFDLPLPLQAEAFKIFDLQ